ncbi:MULTISPECIES: TIGR02281 family clan AA aspartic protease [Rhizobium]|uniref:Aspartyl protease family protein n=1 Tax=Rhizobium metallidurans TaxID=1265931 RepID=A0A7W6CLG0_9HYPH|nr:MULTISPECIES: TIGR02281 family clan AA aspartic protease [Rhizobium]MBB3963195.1 aspartyl protease family protein [Rhizobium metallidurans]
MNRLTIGLGGLGIGLLILLFNSDSPRILGVRTDDFGRMLYLLPIALMLAAGIWGRRISVGETMRHMMIWLVLILGLATAYLYRYDALSVGNRLLAGLIPGRAVVTTTSDGSKEVILYKLQNGHFEADVQINGQTISMLVDTGASMIALSRQDAERVGIIPDNLTYSMSVTTANGRTQAAPVTLSEVAIGPIVRNNIAGSVAEDGRLDQSLLGMSFLGTLGSLQMQPDELRMRD